MAYLSKMQLFIYSISLLCYNKSSNKHKEINMNRYAKAVLTESLINKAKTNGLKIELRVDKDADSPRQMHQDTKIALMDYDCGDVVFTKEQFAHATTTQQMIDAMLEALINQHDYQIAEGCYAPIYADKTDCKNLAGQSDANEHSMSVVGLIFMPMDHWNHNDQRINDYLIDLLQTERFENEIQELFYWLNNRVYRYDLLTLQDKFVAESAVVYGENQLSDFLDNDIDYFAQV